jgi:hypothetical protein
MKPMAITAASSKLIAFLGGFVLLIIDRTAFQPR